VATFVVGGSSVRVWKKGGHWAAMVDDVPVGGRHMTEAQAAGAALLHVCGHRVAPAGRAAVAVTGTHCEVA
jgi:hypothetical protein